MVSGGNAGLAGFKQGFDLMQGVRLAPLERERARLQNTGLGLANESAGLANQISRFELGEAQRKAELMRPIEERTAALGLVKTYTDQFYQARSKAQMQGILEDAKRNPFINPKMVSVMESQLQTYPDGSTVDNNPALRDVWETWVMGGRDLEEKLKRDIESQLMQQDFESRQSLQSDKYDRMEELAGKEHGYRKAEIEARNRGMRDYAAAQRQPADPFSIPTEKKNYIEAVKGSIGESMFQLGLIDEDGVRQRPDEEGKVTIFDPVINKQREVDWTEARAMAYNEAYDAMLKELPPGVIPPPAMRGVDKEYVKGWVDSLEGLAENPDDMADSIDDFMKRPREEQEFGLMVMSDYAASLGPNHVDTFDDFAAGVAERDPELVRDAMAQTPVPGPAPRRGGGGLQPESEEPQGMLGRFGRRIGEIGENIGGQIMGEEPDPAEEPPLRQTARRLREAANSVYDRATKTAADIGDDAVGMVEGIQSLFGGGDPQSGERARSLLDASNELRDVSERVRERYSKPRGLKPPEPDYTPTGRGLEAGLRTMEEAQNSPEARKKAFADELDGSIKSVRKSLQNKDISPEAKKAFQKTLDNLNKVSENLRKTSFESMVPGRTYTLGGSESPNDQPDDEYILHPPDDPTFGTYHSRGGLDTRELEENLARWIRDKYQDWFGGRGDDMDGVYPYDPTQITGNGKR